MAQGALAPVPALAPAFALRIERAAPVTIGAVAAGGARAHVAVTGGTFSGEGLEGRLVGGGEALLARGDGVTVVEASYLIACAGSVVRAFGTGYRTADGAFAGLRLALLFEAAQDAPLAHLATRAFMAEEPAGASTMTVCRID